MTWVSVGQKVKNLPEDLVLPHFVSVGTEEEGRKQFFYMRQTVL